MKRLIKIFLNWKYLICYGVAWLVVHGPGYAVGIIGLITGNEWCLAAFAAWYGFLWLPFMPENIIFTFPLSIWLQEKLFPNDDDLHKLLCEQLKKLKEKKNGRRN